SSHISGLATYFREYLRQDLGNILENDAKKKPDPTDPNNKIGIPYNLYNDGLKIYTTIDSRMQKYAEEAAAEHLASLQRDFFGYWKKQVVKGKQVYSWGRGPRKDPGLIDKMMKRTQRYKEEVNGGATKNSIKK